MSTSILYHAFGLKGIEYRATHYHGRYVVFSAEMSTRKVVCPGCGNSRIIYKGRKRRQFWMPPIGRKRCILDLLIHRVQCTQCGKLWWPRLSFLIGKHSFVRSFALQVLDLLKIATIRDVAEYMGVGWDLIKTIHKMKLKRMYRRIPVHDIQYLGIDEFSIRKGHEYMTIFVDLATGRIVHAVEGKSKESITPFLKKLAMYGTNLKAIAMDMSSSFFWAVNEILPEVAVVFDRFHVMALMNKAIDSMRRDYQRQLDKTEKKTLKGSRFLLLRNYEELNPEHKSRLDILLEVNQPLAKIHLMKEQLRRFWDLCDRKRAADFLWSWCQDALSSGIKHLAKVAKTLMVYRRGLLAYSEHRITNAPVEGLVNKIKTLKRQAYGFRDMEYFKLRLYHLHTQRYSLAG